MVLIEALVHQKKGLLLILLKQEQNFVWVYIIMLKKLLLCWWKKNLYEADKKMLTFQLNFVLEVNSNWLSNIESREICLNGNVCDFFGELQLYRSIWYKKLSHVFNEKE